MSKLHPYGITGFGAYIPRQRMARAAIAAAHKWMAPALRALANGQRAFCAWDEDSVTMAIEAARDALNGTDRTNLRSIFLASTTMPFADLQNSAIVASALDLPGNMRTLDIGHSERAGVSGLFAALHEASGPALFIASDRPRAKPASVQEMRYGASAAAFTLGEQRVIAQLIGSASRNSLFVDHFRPSGGSYPYFWEERWVRDEGLLKLIPETVGAALAEAGLKPADVSRFMVPSTMEGGAEKLAKQLGIAPAAAADSLVRDCGYSGAAHGLLMFAHALETAAPGDVAVLVGFGQGCQALVFRVTDAIRDISKRSGVTGCLASGQVREDYLRMLSAEGGIELDWGMRAERVVKTALTEQHRSSSQLAALTAGKCGACGTVQFPQMPYCVNPECNEPMHGCAQHSLVDEEAEVLTYTADWLAYHPSPPLYTGFAQFKSGARLLMEFVDVDPARMQVGAPVRMVMRRKDLDRTFGYARYFWKATPIVS